MGHQRDAPNFETVDLVEGTANFTKGKGVTFSLALLRFVDIVFFQSSHNTATPTLDRFLAKTRTLSLFYSISYLNIGSSF
jgi:hypothetical protein